MRSLSNRFTGYRKAFLFLVLTVTISFVYIQNSYAVSNCLVREWINKGAIVVDVRTSGEYDEWHFKGSQNIPLDEIEKRLSFFGSTDTFIIVYCRRGNRSGVAKSILEKYGFKNVINGGGLDEMRSLQ